MSNSDGYVLVENIFVSDQIPLEESATSTSSTFGAITDSKQFQFLATSAKLASFSKRTLSFLLWSIATGALLLFLGAILLQTATGGFGK
jgi:hypothetical protein